MALLKTYINNPQICVHIPVMFAQISANFGCKEKNTLVFILFTFLELVNIIGGHQDNGS